VAAGELDDFGRAVLERSLRVRGLVDCARVITDAASVTSGRTMYLRRRTNTVYPFYPGPMQLRYEVPEGVDAVDIVFGLRDRGEDGLGAAVLVKWGGAPIEFEYELGALDDPGDATGESGRIREVTLVDGDWDLQLPPQEVEENEFDVPLRNLSPGQVFFVALAAVSESDLTASNVRVVPRPFVPEGDETGTDTGTEDAPSAADDDRPVHAEGAVAGECGCRSGGTGVAGLFVLVAVAGVARRRRR
jgi:MYXO-CTERM domain-containing protein